MKIRKLLSNKHGRRLFRLPGMPSVPGVLLAFCLCLLMCTGLPGIAARADGRRHGVPSSSACSLWYLLTNTAP